MGGGYRGGVTGQRRVGVQPDLPPLPPVPPLPPAVVGRAGSEAITWGTVASGCVTISADTVVVVTAGTLDPGPGLAGAEAAGVVTSGITIDTGSTIVVVVEVVVEVVVVVVVVAVVVNDVGIVSVGIVTIGVGFGTAVVGPGTRGLEGGALVVDAEVERGEEVDVEVGSSEEAMVVGVPASPGLGGLVKATAVGPPVSLEGADSAPAAATVDTVDTALSTDTTVDSTASGAENVDSDTT